MNSAMTPSEVRDVRARLGLTQEALAAAMGVRLRTVARWEGGGNVPKTAANLMYVLVRLTEKERA